MSEVTIDQANEAQNNTDASVSDQNQQAKQEVSTLLNDGNQKQEGEVSQVKSEVAPESYEAFTLPEGITIEKSKLEEFTTLAKESKLSQDGAQKLIDIATKHTQELLDSQKQAWNETRDAWVSEIKEDKEFGGSKFNETCDRANRVLRKYGSDSLISELGKGLGDNPELIKMLTRIDKAMSEDKVVDGTPSGVDTRSPAEVIYGKN